MNELIKVEKSSIQDEQVQTVDARQLYEFLGSKRQFGNWILAKVIDNQFFMENQDYILLNQTVRQNGSGGHNRKDYALTVDTAKKVSMAEQTEAGNKARDYFLDCEKVARGMARSTIGSDRKEELELELIAAKYAAEILRLSDSSKLEMMHIVYENNRVPTKALPQYTEKVKVAYSATHLLKLNNCQLKTRAFNVAMINTGYLEQMERMASRGKMKKYNSLTEKGLKFGQNDAFKGSSTETQPHYYRCSFMELYGLLLNE